VPHTLTGGFAVNKCMEYSVRTYRYHTAAPFRNTTLDNTEHFCHHTQVAIWLVVAHLSQSSQILHVRPS